MDSLDLACYVMWEPSHLKLMAAMEEGQEAARKESKPLPWRETALGPCLMHPKGKAPMYRFHLQVKDFHFFVGIGQCSDSYPNVYVSFKAHTLWKLGSTEAVDRLKRLLTELGGEIQSIKPSRVDLCADFLGSEALQFDFLRSLGVPENIQTCGILQGARLETYYIGAKKASIRARVYDKAREIVKSGKTWMLDVWDVDCVKDVWRVEFQLRRPALKAYGVESMPELQEKLGGLWRDLTCNWFSLRLRDNPNTTRRTIHPWWQAVRACAEKFGDVVEVKRDLTRNGKAGAQYYVTRAANGLCGFAACLGLPDREEAIVEFCKAIERYWDEKDFDEAYAVRVVELAGPAESEGAEDEIPF